MTELLAALCASARDGGHDAELDSSEFQPLEPDTAYVVIPHEHYETEPASWPSGEQRARTIALCVENPFTQWFEKVSSLAPQFARTFAINRASVDELRRRGVAAEHLQLGYTPHWDSWQSEQTSRPIDVTYLGAADPRRDALLAGYGRWLWHRRTAFLAPPLAPKPGSRPDYLVDGVKYRHLCRTKLLINLHRKGSRSFEWARALQAIINGCVVVSEPSLDHAPLVPGEHFVVATAESIPHVVEGLLREPERPDAIRVSAYEMVRQELDMGVAAERLVEAARELIDGGSRATFTDTAPEPLAAPIEDHPAPRSDVALLRAAVRNLSTDTLGLHRAVQRMAERAEGRDPDQEPDLVECTSSYPDATPGVSVVVTLHNYEREVVKALASVDRSEYEDYEVLVLDDASTDGSLRAVREFLLERPWIPAAVLRQRVNRGPAASRNALARRARGELMFVLDADNEIYPTALGRLVEALDGDPGAAFAYPLIEVTRSDVPIGLLSRYAWDPEGFRKGNYVDAMALIRMDDYLALGGFNEDVRIAGWEDFDFWCACAETGRRGRLVPEVLARYPRTDHSVLSRAATDDTTAWSVMRSRFPTILPATPPG
jgi:hypothetical protein